MTMPDTNTTPTPRHHRRLRRFIVVATLLIILGLFLVNRAATPSSSNSGGTTVQNITAHTGNALYDAICNNRVDMSTIGTMKDSNLQEISGIIASRKSADSYWVHNDSGDTARIFAISSAGKLLSTVNFSDIDAIDWEDIAAGPGPQSGTTYLYAADTGDNKLVRGEVELYRIPEPTPEQGGSDVMVSGAETLHFSYPDGEAHNTEAVFVDPVSAKIYFIDKSDVRSSHIYEAPAGLVDGSHTELTDIGNLGYKLGGKSYERITAADISPSGNTIAVRTYEHLYVYDRPVGGSVAAALSGQACTVPAFSETHGEAAAFTRSGAGLVTTSEGSDQPIHLFQPK